MSRWFRFYDEALDDPKVQLLTPELFKAWVNLLCVASKHDGAIVVDNDLAFRLRCKPERVRTILDLLIERGLIEERGDFYVPHNWDGRQYKSDVTDPTASERQQRYRNKKRNATVTPPVTDKLPDTETEQRQKQKEAIGSFRTVGSEDVKGRKAPAHGATGKNHIWISAGSTDWELYAEDFRAAHGEYPKPDDRGGKWFKVSGESVGRVA